MRNQRRSKRLPFHISVRVYGRTPANLPFRNLTETTNVSAHGGQLLLGIKVRRGQDIVLVHNLTDEERHCRVVHVAPSKGGKVKVGVEFSDGASDFWHVYPSVVALAGSVSSLLAQPNLAIPPERGTFQRPSPF